MALENFVKSVKISGLLALAAAATGCTVVDQGNFAVEKYWGGQYNEKPIESGIHFFDTFFDKYINIYGREYILTIENTSPKDIDKILLKDLDLNISYKVKAEAASDFLANRSLDLIEVSDYNANVLGTKVVDKEVRSILNSVTTKFSSEEMLFDQNKFEIAFKERLQSHLDQLYPKLFDITDVRINNILVSPQIEDKIQQIQLINADLEKNKAMQATFKSKEETLKQKMDLMVKVSRETGVSVEQIQRSELLDIMRENGNSSNTTVTVPVESAKPKL